MTRTRKVWFKHLISIKRRGNKSRPQRIFKRIFPWLDHLMGTGTLTKIVLWTAVNYQTSETAKISHLSLGSFLANIFSGLQSSVIRCSTGFRS
jgi:hypothetical protein